MLSKDLAVDDFDRKLQGAIITCISLCESQTEIHQAGIGNLPSIADPSSSARMDSTVGSGWLTASPPLAFYSKYSSPALPAPAAKTAVDRRRIAKLGGGGVLQSGK